jgi:hypothetical protein
MPAGRGGRQMAAATVTRRTVVAGAALGAAALPLPFVRGARAAGEVAPHGKMVLAWHTNIAARWLDPQQHDGTASPDNFLMAAHDALIKNFREVKYDHPALAEKFQFGEALRGGRHGRRSNLGQLSTRGPRLRRRYAPLNDIGEYA